MDIVYVTKYGYANFFDLRYSLRSLDYNFEHDKVRIVGELPSRIQNVNHLKMKDDKGRKQLNVLEKIITACEHPDISDNFILMNDDFFILEKIKSIPYYKLGTIKDHVEHRKESGMKETIRYSKHINSSYNKFENGDDFEVHVPIKYNKNNFLKMIDEFGRDTLLPKRTLYCNHYGIEGVTLENTPNYNGNEKITDCKCFKPGQFEIYDNQPFFSTGDFVSRYGRFVRRIQEKFPNPSKYEKPKHK